MKTLPDLNSSFKREDFDGYIFDCDGTLADSMPLHYRAWSESLQEKLGRPATEYTEDLFYRFGGMPAWHIVERLNQDFGYNLPPEQTAYDKEMHFVKLLPGIGPGAGSSRRVGESRPIGQGGGGLRRVDSNRARYA